MTVFGIGKLDIDLKQASAFAFAVGPAGAGVRGAPTAGNAGRPIRAIFVIYSVDR